MKIVSKTTLAEGIKQLEISAPEISSKALPGQFVILRVNEKGERIPLTIASNNKTAGTITVVFQEVGKTTRMLGKIKKGGSLADLTGPLGRPSEVKKYGSVVAIGGGVGIAELLPVVMALKKAGNKITCIIGARSAKMLIFENELRDICDKLLVATDDGSRGKKAFVTDLLASLIKDGASIDYVYAVGPVPMMKKVCEITRTVPVSPLATTVSLNPIMVDGTGMCGSCRVTVGAEIKFACVDGPEFDGHKVGWDELLTRNKFFSEQEKIATECHCKKS